MCASEVTCRLIMTDVVEFSSSSLAPPNHLGATVKDIERRGAAKALLPFGRYGS